MRFVVLALVLIVGSAATSEAQVFKPRGRGALAKKADPSLVPAAAKKADPVKTAQAQPVQPAANRKVTTKAKKPGAKKKRHRGDDDDVKVSDDDDDVKVSDD